MKLDLHLHTTASDGTDEPAQLIRRLAGEGFVVAAITDHDTMAGVKEAQAEGQRDGVRVLTGVELSAGGDTEIHLLGYGMRAGEELQGELKRMKTQRNQRMRRMVERLNAMGVSVTFDQVLKKADGTIGRAHLARVLVEQGYVKNIREAFQKYLAPGKCGYVPREKLSVRMAISLIRDHGGVPVLAHPGIIEGDPFWLPERIKEWRNLGLMGIEAHHPRHTAQQCAYFTELARSLDLLVTGGSDYHGANKQVLPGMGMEHWAGKDEDFYALVRKIDQCP